MNRKHIIFVLICIVFLNKVEGSIYKQSLVRKEVKQLIDIELLTNSEIKTVTDKSSIEKVLKTLNMFQNPSSEEPQESKDGAKPLIKNKSLIEKILIIKTPYIEEKQSEIFFLSKPEISNAIEGKATYSLPKKFDNKKPVLKPKKLLDFIKETKEVSSVSKKISTVSGTDKLGILALSYCEYAKLDEQYIPFGFLHVIIYYSI